MGQASGSDGDEDDAFALADASLLAFLADCDMAQDANAIPSFLPESPRSGFSLDQQLSSRQSATKSWRQLRREEALDLRELAKELATQLQRLKLSTRERPTPPKAAKPAKSRKRRLTWEEQARRQALLRQSSHMENAWLKDALRCRQLQAKQLLRGFKRRLRNEVVKASIDLCERLHVDGRGVTPPTDNEAVFHELMAGMDEMYADLDGFFEKVKMRELPCPGRRNTTPRSRAEGKFVEFLDCHAVPFDVQKTERAIWKCMGEEEAQDPKAVFAECFSERDNTLMQSTWTAFTAGSVNIRASIRKVARRYIERDRTVFIFRRLIEPVHTGVSIAFHETTRLVVKPGKASDLGPTAVMQSHRQATANDDAYAMYVPHISRTFIDLGVAAWENSIARFNHCVEDALLRETL